MTDNKRVLEIIEMIELQTVESIKEAIDGCEHEY